jgi:Zn-finger nucleic acid-binding protein
MNCPVCDARLRVIEKFNVEIDICPECKGVWLDRGELEKIIEMVSAGGPSRDSRPHDVSPRQEVDHRNTRHDFDDDDDDDHRRRVQYDQHGRPIRKKRESWFSEIFDSFGGGD